MNIPARPTIVTTPIKKLYCGLLLLFLKLFFHFGMDMDLANCWSRLYQQWYLHCQLSSFLSKVCCYGERTYRKGSPQPHFCWEKQNRNCKSMKTTCWHHFGYGHGHKVKPVYKGPKKESSCYTWDKVMRERRDWNICMRVIPWPLHQVVQWWCSRGKIPTKTSTFFPLCVSRRLLHYLFHLWLDCLKCKEYRLNLCQTTPHEM